MRCAGTVGCTKADYGQRRAWKAKRGGMPCTLESLRPHHLPAGHEESARKQIIDVPVQTLGRAAMPGEPSAQPPWAKRASCIHVPAGGEREHTQPAQPDARTGLQMAEKQVGPRTVEGIAKVCALAVPGLEGLGRMVSIAADPAGGVAGSCDRSSLPISVARSREQKPSSSQRTRAR
jgi:hypothetical protein